MMALNGFHRIQITSKATKPKYNKKKSESWKRVISSCSIINHKMKILIAKYGKNSDFMFVFI